MDEKENGTVEKVEKDEDEYGEAQDDDDDDGGEQYARQVREANSPKSDEERGYYEDTRAKGYHRNDDYDEDEWFDDRDQFEDFELITKKFIPVIHDITDDIMENDLRSQRERFHIYRADWEKEKNRWK